MREPDDNSKMSYRKDGGFLIKKSDRKFLMDVLAKFRLVSSYRLFLIESAVRPSSNFFFLAFSDGSDPYLSLRLFDHQTSFFTFRDGKIIYATIATDHDIYFPSLHLLKNLKVLYLIFLHPVGKFDFHPLPPDTTLSIKLYCEMDFDFSGFGYVKVVKIFLNSQTVYLSSLPDSDLLDVEGSGILVVDVHDRKVREILINDVELSFESPLPCLKRLEMVNSHLHISSGIFFPSLSILSLCFSWIEPSMDMLYELFNSCRAKEVNIIGLEEYGFLAGQTGLVCFRLYNGYLSRIPDFFSEFKGLSELKIKSSGLEQLKFPLLPNLKKLDVSGNLLETIDDVCALQELRILNVSGNCLATIPECLSSLPHLQELDVSCNPLESIPDCFYDMHSLKFHV